MNLTDATSPTHGLGLAAAVLSAADNTVVDPKPVTKLDKMCVLDQVEKLVQVTQDLLEAKMTPLERYNLLMELDARVNTLRTTVKKLL